MMNQNNNYAHYIICEYNIYYSNKYEELKQQFLPTPRCSKVYCNNMYAVFFSFIVLNFLAYFCFILLRAVWALKG